MTQRTACLALLSLLAIGVPLQAGATDGVIEINHAIAVSGGLGSGDTAGYPVTIGEPGAYVLTSDLTPPPGLGGIEIDPATGPVSIDLNGFSISGSGGPGGAGISGGHHVSVSGGAVHGMGGRGIDIGAESTVRDCRVFENDGDEMVLGNGSSYGGNLISNGATAGASVVGGASLGGNRCDGDPCPAASRTFVFDHLLESDGGIGGSISGGGGAGSTSTFDTTIFITHSAGLPGTPGSNEAVDVDLYIFDERTGGVAVSSLGTAICNPCSFTLGAGAPRKITLPLADLFASGGGFPDNDGDGSPDPTFSGFATMVVTGNTAAFSTRAQEQRGEERASGDFALAVFVFEPQEIAAAS